MDIEIKQIAKSKEEIRADIINIIENALSAKGYHLTKQWEGKSVHMWDIFDNENDNYHGFVAV